MTFCENKNLPKPPSDRCQVVVISILSMILDFYLKYNPDKHWAHLFYGASPILEILVIFGMLANSVYGNKLAMFACVLDLVSGVFCLLTLPVISVAENATGVRLHLPYISTFHSQFSFQVSTPVDLFYVATFLGFVSTILILLFLILDALKFMKLRKLRNEDLEKEKKMSPIEKV
ncbi:hypothetical protein L5515_005255 [Caenorhabditis briggsae]|uniref:Uncharacterized protein n=1 Tax=Caenorhabditis briggsae TaxID=6238 RepID=A0AAE9EP73_CAEBR|nr:hypothetical protein L5515_005255 [Caenorhabditis briggsae]